MHSLLKDPHFLKTGTFILTQDGLQHTVILLLEEVRDCGGRVLLVDGKNPAVDDEAVDTVADLAIDPRPVSQLLFSFAISS